MYEKLMDEVVTDENRVRALEAVKRNRGSAGIDGMKTTELEKHLQAHWERIRAKLLAGTYVPSPVRRVEIPKPNGGTRTLGIPTVSANCTRAQFAFGMGGGSPSVPSASRPALPGFEGASNRRY
jgi:retron-type reverse transcriptase